MRGGRAPVGDRWLARRAVAGGDRCGGEQQWIWLTKREGTTEEEGARAAAAGGSSSAAARCSVLPRDGPRCCWSPPPPRRVSRRTPFGRSSSTASTRPPFAMVCGGHGEPTACGGWRQLAGSSALAWRRPDAAMVVSARSPLVNLLRPRAPVASDQRHPWVEEMAEAACSCTTTSTSGGAAAGRCSSTLFLHWNKVRL